MVISVFAKETTLFKAHSQLAARSASSSACVSSSIVGRNNFHWRVAVISQLRRVARDDWRSTDAAVFISRTLTMRGGGGNRDRDSLKLQSRRVAERACAISHIYFHVPRSCPTARVDSPRAPSPDNSDIPCRDPWSTRAIEVITRLIMRTLRKQEQDSRVIDSRAIWLIKKFWRLRPRTKRSSQKTHSLFDEIVVKVCRTTQGFLHNYTTNGFSLPTRSLPFPRFIDIFYLAPFFLF